jgi:hypothetical protein
MSHPPKPKTIEDQAAKAVDPAANCSAFTSYIPEVWEVKKDAIYAAIHAIESGLEYARQCLCDHDAALGRTTHKNRTWAETIEGDIRQMENARDLLPVRQPNTQLFDAQRSE